MSTDPDLLFVRTTSADEADGWKTLKDQIIAAERRGYELAIAKLHAKDAIDEEEFNRTIREHPENWDGWGYFHDARKLAEHLEAIKEEQWAT